MVQDRLVELTDRIPIHDSRIRRHEPGGVHGMRVTLRRLRSLLASIEPLLSGVGTASLREELAWVAGELGGARDSEVASRRIKTLARTPKERAVADLIEAQLLVAEAAAMQRSVAALDSTRFSELLRSLNSFVSDPPWDDAVEGSSDEPFLHVIRRDLKRMQRRVTRAIETSPGSEKDAALHEVRKAAKRLRYSAETLIPAYGDDARRLSRRAKRIQTELGEVQDSMVSQKVLITAGRAAGVQLDDAFVLGGFCATERQLSATAEARYARAWAKLTRKKLRRWLR